VVNVYLAFVTIYQTEIIVTKNKLLINRIVIIKNELINLIFYIFMICYVKIAKKKKKNAILKSNLKGKEFKVNLSVHVM